MKGTRIRFSLSVLSSITSAFTAHSEVSWDGEGIQCSRIEAQKSRLGTQDGRTFIPLANPTIEGSIKNSREQFKKSLAEKVSYTDLTPYTDPKLLNPLLENSFETTISWHPFYTRLLSNVSPNELLGESNTSDLANFTDQKSTPTSPKKRTADLHFIKLKAAEGAPFLPTDQVAFELNQRKYPNIAIAIFANPKFFGGDTNDKESLFYMNTAQEERTFLCFPGLFAAAEASKVVHKVTWAGNGVYEPFNKEKTLMQGALPRYRYCQDGIDKNLAPGSEIIRVKEDGSLGFKEAPKFSTFAVQNALMHFVSTTETFPEIKDKHGKQMCAYNPIEPITVDLVFTAAPDLSPCKLPVNTFISLEYFEALVEDLKTQMEALNKGCSETFITGPIGCGIFGNDPRAVALAYAYVLMYHSPEALKNVAITDSNFYDLLKKAWTTIDEIQLSEDETEKSLLGRIFEEAFPAEKMDERQLNFGQNNLCPPNIPLAAAFDTLARLKNESEAKELLEAQLAKVLETPLREDFEKLEDRSGKTLEKRLEEYVAHLSK